MSPHGGLLKKKLGHRAGPGASEAPMQDLEGSGMAVSHQKYDIFNGERFPHACCVTLMFMCRRRRRSREDKPLPRRHFLLQLGKAGSRRRRWRRRALVVVDQRAAMGSWARTRCDLAMMEAESAKG